MTTFPMLEDEEEGLVGLASVRILTPEDALECLTEDIAKLKNCDCKKGHVEDILRLEKLRKSLISDLKESWH